MKKFIIYYLYFAPIVFVLNDEENMGIFSCFFIKNCRDNPSQLYVFLFSSLLALFAIITIPRYRTGNESSALKNTPTKLNEIQNLEIKIFGLVPFYETRFLWIPLITKYKNSHNGWNAFEAPKYVYIFVILSDIMVTIVIPLTLIWVVISLCMYGALGISTCLDIIYLNINKRFLPLAGPLFLFSCSFALIKIFNGGKGEFYLEYTKTRYIQYSLDLENKVFKAIKGPKGDIPLHTLNSFRRHSFYPTGIIHNNSDLLCNTPGILDHEFS